MLVWKGKVIDGQKSKAWTTDHGGVGLCKALDDRPRKKGSQRKIRSRRKKEKS